MDTWSWLEAIAWWLFAIDAIGYNVIAWSGVEWYQRKFPSLAHIFPVTKAFGLLYGGLVFWVGTALARGGIRLFGQ